MFISTKTACQTEKGGRANGNGKTRRIAITSFPMGPALVKDYPEVIDAVRFFRNDMKTQVAKDEKAAKRLHRQRIREVVADKGYHSNDVLTSLKQGGIRSYISEPDRGRRKWNGRRDEQAAVYANRRRIKGDRGKALRRSRAERVESTKTACGSSMKMSSEYSTSP